MTDMKRASVAARFDLRAVSLAALGCLMGVALLAAAAPARAGDGDDNVPLDTKILRGFMEQLGLQRDGSGITYEERAPLVIPPNRELPPPERSDVAVTRNPAWPVDPDIQRAKQEAAFDRKKSWNADETLRQEQNPLRPDQIAPGPKPRSTRHVEDGYRAPPNGSANPLSPSQLGSGAFFDKVFGKDEPVVGHFTGEPARTALTDPPPGYQTPSPNQPYGLGKGVTAPKATNYPVQHGMIEGDH